MKLLLALFIANCDSDSGNQMHSALRIFLRRSSSATYYNYLGRSLFYCASWKACGEDGEASSFGFFGPLFSLLRCHCSSCSFSKSPCKLWSNPKIIVCQRERATKLESMWFYDSCSSMQQTSENTALSKDVLWFCKGTYCTIIGRW